MKRIYQFLIFVAMTTVLGCGKCKPRHTQSNDVPKTIDVGINHTIETFMILRALADNDPLFQYRDSSYKGKPIMYEARKAFADYKNHSAVVKTQEMIAATSFTGDVILQGLLYFEELPSTKLKYEINSELWKNRQDSLKDYIAVLADFYTEANVNAFISNHADFYEGTITEAESYLEADLIPTMEDYFKMENEGYKMLLIPNSPFGMGFGASTSTKDGDLFFQIISPASETEWNSAGIYANYGYTGEGAQDYYDELVVHEFCHSFITPFITHEQWRTEIAKTDSLFTPKLKAIMEQEGYGSWWGYVNEHLVRLGELRVAKMLNAENYEAMRQGYIDKGFVLLPAAEECILNYENNPTKYATFHAFIPELILQLETFSCAEINNKLDGLESHN